MGKPRDPGQCWLAAHVRDLRGLRGLRGTCCLLCLLAPVAGAAAGCAEDPPPVEEEAASQHTGMSGSKADCEFPILTLRLGDSEPREVDIDGLPVEELYGGEKAGADLVDVVRRRGVRMSELFARAAIAVADATPVNCVARDGYDPLRTRLGNDVSRLPSFGFVRDEGYVYLGGGGEKDPLYPLMEGKSLMMDYDLAGEGEVPAALGGTLPGIGQFRWKMLEKYDEQQRGLLEIDPVVGR
ncbi:MAG: hypothetical protein FJ125_04440 [Deltaproteobacteria bacterium]|nr:hypothetical protein [Deltaproteobacteria bacterium]